ncbi:MAG: DUF2769 domain-containing protein [Chloroflexi bacterium]|nr:DUF2769 domain-containing protein [Chloroflexota bacterium]
MSQLMSTIVPFNTSTVAKCICPKCPVQSKSLCVSEKMSKMGDALKSNLLDPAAIPGDYCATGTAICRDINTRQSCICGGCPVFAQYKLARYKPLTYYCRDGVAK